MKPTVRERALHHILQVISRSRDDEAPVFEAILDNAQALCNTQMSGLILARADDPHQVLAAHRGLVPAAVDLFRSGRMKLEADLSYAARSIVEGRLIALADMRESDLHRAGSPVVRSMVDDSGIRSVLFVPLMQDGVAIGTITLFRRDVDPFDAREIALVETFAAQAVIAIENVRQFREVQTRLERERILAEILALISQSRDNDQPVFEAITQQAATVCEADQASMILVNEARSLIRLVAEWGHEANVFSIGKTSPIDKPMSVTETLRTGKTVHITDYAESALYKDGDTLAKGMVDIEGIRTRLVVPLLKAGVTVGIIALSRRTVRPFSTADIQLVETFAAQAVIAIENVRQFREVQTRLEREEATKDILQVISASRAEHAQVFETLLDRAVDLLHSEHGSVWLLSDDETMIETVARRVQDAAASAGFDRRAMSETDSIVAAVVRSCSVWQADDLLALPEFADPSHRNRAWVEHSGARSMLLVPLERNGQGIGLIAVYRRRLQPYSTDDVQLLQSFAAQAVIAIENVRQFREVRTRLERERASAEVLELISQSRSDAGPVFDAILQRGARLCGSDYAGLALISENGSELVYTAHHGPDLKHSQHDQMRWALDGKSSFADAMRLKRPVLIPDLEDTDLYRAGDPQRVAHVDSDGLHSFMAVPLILNGNAIGAFGIARFAVRPFHDDDRALIESFAAQAVIAIENVRQFKALERLNAELGERVQAQVGELERMGRLKRFLPEQVADAVVSSGDDRMLSSHRALIAALFCDMRGFTAFCETAEPEETIEVLQTYHEEMGRLISAHGAGVDTRAGDGIMVLFNDPLPCDDPAGQALRLAFAMRDRMADLCARWRKMGHRLGFGVGVSLGYATVGMVGSEGRFHYTASGTAVNLAARLCDMARDGEILLSPRAAIAVEDTVATESMSEVEIKGISAPVEVMRAVAPRA